MQSSAMCVTVTEEQEHMKGDSDVLCDTDLFSMD